MSLDVLNHATRDRPFNNYRFYMFIKMITFAARHDNPASLWLLARLLCRDKTDKNACMTENNSDLTLDTASAMRKPSL